jgi:alkylated DNA repair dioxygenase AlkB
LIFKQVLSLKVTKFESQMQQFDLGLTREIETINLESGFSQTTTSAAVQFLPQFYSDQQATDLFRFLYDGLKWQEETLRIAGKDRKVPRLIAWYGDRDAEYRYSGRLHRPLPWPEPLIIIKHEVEKELGVNFNSVLCNLYRNGQDSMGWHADDEKELGAEPVIASVSLGASRYFHLKHKTESKMRHKILLTSGSLLVMKGTTQQFWLHQVPKEPKVTQPRINLTFRQIIG